jgi:hypothetical protein
LRSALGALVADLELAMLDDVSLPPELAWPDDAPEPPAPLELDIPEEPEPMPDPPLAPTEAPPEVRGVTCEPLPPDAEELAFGGFAAELRLEAEPLDPEAPLPVLPPVLPMVLPPVVPPVDPVPALEPVPAEPEDPLVWAIGAEHHTAAAIALRARSLKRWFMYFSVVG